VKDLSATPSISRRACERFRLALPIVLITSNYGTTVISKGRTSDLSEGGMRVHSDASLRDGQPVSVEFTLPLLSQLVKMRATVKHRSDDLYGLQFDQASEQQLHQIRELAAFAC
jgi:hypothetical protein